MLAVPPEEVRTQLEKIVASDTFVAAERSKQLLRYLIEQTIGGHGDRLKEYTIGTEGLGRSEAFDPRTDPIVRAEASRLRNRLDLYYAAEGRKDELIITLPKGGYVLTIEARAPTPPSATSAPQPHGRRIALPTDRIAAFVVGAVAAALLVAAYSVIRGANPRPIPLLHVDVDLGGAGELGSEVGTDVVISPDGSTLVFVAYASVGTPRLVLKRLDGSAMTVLSGTEGARVPFFSPDGRWVAFWALGKLKKVPTTGGTAVVLCDATDLLGGSWGDDDQIIAVLDSTGNLWRVPAAGGSPVSILDLTREASAPRWPQVLPGAHAVVYAVLGPLGADAARIEVLSLRDQQRTTLVRDGTFPRFLRSGHLAYVNQGTVFAVSFDADTLRIVGSPIPVLDDVAYSEAFGYAQFDASQTGTLVYLRAALSGATTVQWVDHDGHAEPLLAKPARYAWPRLSPDGSRLAVVAFESGRSEVWIIDRATRRVVRQTRGDRFYMSPVWTQDGRFLIVGSGDDVLWMSATEGSRTEPLIRDRGRAVPWSFTPDGGRLALYTMSPTSAFDLWTVPIEATGNGVEPGEPEVYLQTPAFEVYPSFSPDGRWIAYSSNESGVWDVYVRPFPKGGAAVQVSRGGGRIPKWAADGQRLYYGTDDRHVMMATYSVVDGQFRSGEPRLWTPVELGDAGVLPNFDLAPDGDHIAALMPAAAENRPSPSHVTFVQNFFAEIERRMQKN
jgi:serine/threonine-protein kinase